MTFYGAGQGNKHTFRAQICATQHHSFRPFLM